LTVLRRCASERRAFRALNQPLLKKIDANRCVWSVEVALEPSGTAGAVHREILPIYRPLGIAGTVDYHSP